MSEYREIQGAAVQSLASSTGTIEGQIWYDNVNAVFKLQSVNATAAWSSGGNLNNTSQSRAGFGSQTLAIAGPGVGPSGAIATTETYDGSTWTNGNSSTRTPSDKNRYTSGAGTPTAGLIALGGYPAPNLNTETEEWDGTSWTASNPASVARRGPVLGGIQTEALAIGGYSDPTATYQNSTEEYDGTSWTSGGNLNTARGNSAGSSKGSQTAFLITSGNTPALTSNTEEYDGTSWTEVNNQPTAVAYQGYAGTQTDCLVWNGYTPSVVTTTYNYDGTSWSSNPASLSFGRLNYHNNAGTASAAIVFGGEGPGGPVTTTEEFLGAGAPITQTITTT